MAFRETVRNTHHYQYRIDTGKAWTREDLAIYNARRSESLNEMLIADRFEYNNYNWLAPVHKPDWDVIAELPDPCDWL